MKLSGHTLAIVVVVALSVHAAQSQAETTLYAMTTDNYLISFDASMPGSLLAARPITGLQSSEEVVGLDYWSNGQLYALGDSSRLYTVNTGTGQATAVSSSQFTPLLDGLSFGFDNTPAGARIISDLNQNLLIDRTTGAGITSGPSLLPSSHVDGLAYNPTSGVLYGIDSLLNALVTIDSATGTVTTVGPIGIDCSRNSGFDIEDSGKAYLATPAASSDPAANLYMINLSTGAATLVGLIGAPGDNVLVRGLTVAGTPEPATLSLLGLGCLALIRRRRGRVARI